jgi:hypothetical protein
MAIPSRSRADYRWWSADAVDLGTHGQGLGRKGGNYLLTDTDSMFFVASERGGLYPCTGGQYKLEDGTPAVKAITWKQTN